MKKKQTISKKFLWIVFCSLFIHYYYMGYEGNFTEMFRIIYGYVEFKGNSFMSTLIQWILPQILLICLWGDYVEGDLIRHWTYIRTRTNHMAGYLFKTYARLFSFIVISCSIFFFMTIMLTMSQTSKIVIGWNEVYQMLVYLLYVFLMIMLVNTVSIGIQAIYAASIIIGIQVLLVTIIKSIFHSAILTKIYSMLPISMALSYYFDKFSNFEKVRLLFIGIGAIGITFILNVMILKRKEIL